MSRVALLCFVLLSFCLVPFNKAFVVDSRRARQAKSIPQHEYDCPLNRQQSLYLTLKEQENDKNKNDSERLSSSSSSLSSSETTSKNDSNRGIPGSKPGRGDKDLGGYDPSERIGDGINVGDPQIKVKEKERSVTAILKELAAIQQQGPRKYCILGTRHCSYLHQQIIELLYV